MILSTCQYSKCNLPTSVNRYKKYSTYCNIGCRRLHEQETWQDFVNNAPQCNTPGCTNLANAYKDMPSNNRKYRKTCASTCLHDSRSMHAPICKNELCNNKVRYHTGRQKYDAFCCTSCRNLSPHHMQDPVIFLRVQKKSSKLKDYVYPSGKIVKVQGYEPQALDKLLTKYTEADIAVQMEGNVPTILYVDDNNKSRKYYPDIYVKKDNLIVEVKSRWTYSGTPESLRINTIKKAAAESCGYNFQFMIL